MGQLVTLTAAPVRITANGVYQAFWDWTPALQFDELFIMTQVISIEGATSPSATIALSTAMQNDGEATSNVVFSNSFSAVGVVTNQVVKGNFLGRIFWSMSAFSGMTAMTFWMGGVGRKYGPNK